MPRKVFARKQGIFTSYDGACEIILWGRGSHGYRMPGGEMPGTGSPPNAKISSENGRRPSGLRDGGNPGIAAADR